MCSLFVCLFVCLILEEGSSRLRSGLCVNLRDSFWLHISKISALTSLCHGNNRASRESDRTAWSQTWPVRALGQCQHFCPILVGGTTNLQLSHQWLTSPVARSCPHGRLHIAYRFAVQCPKKNPLLVWQERMQISRSHFLSREHAPMTLEAICAAPRPPPEPKQHPYLRPW